MTQPVNISFAQQREAIQSTPALQNELHSYMQIDLEKEVSDSNYYEITWRIASYVSVIALVVFAATGIFYVAAVNPDFIFFAIALATTVMVPATWVSDYTNGHAKTHAHTYMLATKQLEIAKDMETWSDRQIYTQLHLLTPRWNRDLEARNTLTQIDPNFYRAYIPVMARHQFWKDQVTKVHQVAQKHLDKANEVRAELNQPNADFNEQKRREMDNRIYELRYEAYIITEVEGLPAKIQAAYALYVLANPINDLSEDGTTRTQKEWADFGSIHMLNLAQRQLLMDHENNRNPYFIKKDGTEVDRNWILNHSTQAIAREIFEVA